MSVILQRAVLSRGRRRATAQPTLVLPPWRRNLFYLLLHRCLLLRKDQLDVARRRHVSCITAPNEPLSPSTRNPHSKQENLMSNHNQTSNDRGPLTVDTTVGTVRAPALLLCLVCLDVGYHQRIHVQPFHLQSSHQLPISVNPYLHSPKLGVDSHTTGKFPTCFIHRLMLPRNPLAHLCVALGVLQQTQQERGRLDGPASLAVGVARLGLRGTPYSATKPAERDGLLVRAHVLQVPLGLRQLHVLDGLRCLPCILTPTQPTNPFLSTPSPFQHLCPASNAVLHLALNQSWVILKCQVDNAQN